MIIISLHSIFFTHTFVHDKVFSIIIRILCISYSFLSFCKPQLTSLLWNCLGNFFLLIFYHRRISYKYTCSFLNHIQSIGQAITFCFNWYLYFSVNRLDEMYHYLCLQGGSPEQFTSGIDTCKRKVGRPNKKASQHRLPPPAHMKDNIRKGSFFIPLFKFQD